MCRRYVGKSVWLMQIGLATVLGSTTHAFMVKVAELNE